MRDKETAPCTCGAPLRAAYEAAVTRALASEAARDQAEARLGRVCTELEAARAECARLRDALERASGGRRASLAETMARIERQKDGRR